VFRGERLNKLGDSWFSAKFIEVKCFFGLLLYRVPFNMSGEGNAFTGGFVSLMVIKLRRTKRKEELSFFFEREIALIVC